MLFPFKLDLADHELGFRRGLAPRLGDHLLVEADRLIVLAEILPGPPLFAEHLGQVARLGTLFGRPLQPRKAFLPAFQLPGRLPRMEQPDRPKVFIGQAIDAGVGRQGIGVLLLLIERFGDHQQRVGLERAGGKRLGLILERLLG